MNAQNSQKKKERLLRNTIKMFTILGYQRNEYLTCFKTSSYPNQHCQIKKKKMTSNTTIAGGEEEYLFFF